MVEGWKKSKRKTLCLYLEDVISIFIWLVQHYVDSSLKRIETIFVPFKFTNILSRLAVLSNQVTTLILLNKDTKFQKQMSATQKCLFHIYFSNTMADYQFLYDCILFYFSYLVFSLVILSWNVVNIFGRKRRIRV